jgi:hypothetical protein
MSESLARSLKVISAFLNSCLSLEIPRHSCTWSVTLTIFRIPLIIDDTVVLNDQHARFLEFVFSISVASVTVSIWQTQVHEAMKTVGEVLFRFVATAGSGSGFVQASKKRSQCLESNCMYRKLAASQGRGF